MSGKVIWYYICLLLMLIPSIYSECIEYDFVTADCIKYSDDSSNNVQDQIQNNQDGTSSITEDITITQNSQQVTIKPPSVTVADGKINAQNLDYKNNDITDAQGFEATQDGFNLQSGSVNIREYSFSNIGQSTFSLNPDGTLSHASITSSTDIIYTLPYSNDNALELQKLIHLDSDNDGVSDYVETNNGLNKNSPDTDSDGLSDKEEIIVYCSDAKNPNYFSHEMTDGELAALMNITPDTDNDQLHDGCEQGYQLDKNSLDTDSDGLTDTEEIIKYGTNPLNPDNDGDGILDGQDNYPSVKNINTIDIHTDSGESFELYITNATKIRTEDELTIETGIYTIHTNKDSYVEISQDKISAGNVIIETPTEEIEINATAEITSSRFGLECIDLKAKGRYKWLTNPFAVYVPIDHFDFCIRKSENQNLSKKNTTQSGFFDIVDDYFWLNGAVEYEKKSMAFDDAIESLHQGNYISATTMNGLSYVKDLLITNLNKKNSKSYSSHFWIEEDNARYANILPFKRHHAIRNYQTSYSDTTTIIEQNILTHGQIRIYADSEEQRTAIVKIK